MTSSSAIVDRDIASVFHPNSNLSTATGTTFIESGQGCWIFDAEGRRYLDGMAGLWCTSLGYGNEELVEAASEQMRKLSYAHLFGQRGHHSAILLAERLKEMAPVPISRVFFCCSGSEANDTQLKFVWYMNNALGRPKKKKIISLQNSFHGVTIGSASLSGLTAFHNNFDLPLPGIRHVTCPHAYRFALPGETEVEFASRLAAEFEATVLHEGPDTVAAFIAEPVIGSGGVFIPPRTYFEKIMAVCAKYDIFMIDDEVICGFGRLGTTFGCERVGFKPNSITIAKALSSAYMPIAGVMVPDLMYDTMVDECKRSGSFSHGFTYSGHPVATAVALKTLEIYQRDRVIEQVAAKEPYFIERLHRMREHPLVGDARGMGLVGAVELVEDKETKRSFESALGVGVRAAQFAWQEGLIVRARRPDVLTMCPPLIITVAEIDYLFDKLTKALDLTLDWLRRDGLAAA